jgi:class 3 adenylate cyclase
MLALLLCNDANSQKRDSIPVVNFPLLNDELSLYDYARLRFTFDKTEKPPADLLNKPFQPVGYFFPNDSLYYKDSVQSAWFQFTIRNNSSSDTTVTMIFPGSVSKAVLYKKEGKRLVLIGKTGWVIAVSARTVPDEWGRFNLELKSLSQNDYYLQIPRTGFLYCPRTPVLKSIAASDMDAYSYLKKITRPKLLLSHFFTGIFFMFFLFGIIKYLVLDKDPAWFYYSLVGLSAILFTIAQGEYPPLDFPWFENLRGIELTNLLLTLSWVMQGLFILEILSLKTKFPRITRIIRYYFLFRVLISVSYTLSWIFHTGSIMAWIETYDAMFSTLLAVAWVVYMARIRKGFYQYIFFGALTVLIANILSFIIRWFELYYLLPVWLAEDPRTVVVKFYSIALVIDMAFYFTGLAHRDRQVEKDKIMFQEQLIKQLETNKQFQEKFTAELEQQVIERTAEVVEEKAVVERQSLVIQKEKDKSDELLLNILPAEVADELKEKGFTTARAYENASILFSDIKGFTHVAENMTAKELVKEIDTYFSAFDRIMLKFGLEKIKTIGDAYIAAGGLPQGNLADANKVVQAAIAMQQVVEQYGKERAALGNPYFELRIGIHTGSVVAGVVGIKKFQYDIWGDTVNMAARMEQSGVPGKINVSQYTYELIKNDFSCIHRGKVEAKNKGNVDMYFVESRNMTS